MSYMYQDKTTDTQEPLPKLKQQEIVKMGRGLANIGQKSNALRRCAKKTFAAIFAEYSTECIKKNLRSLKHCAINDTRKAFKYF